MLNLRTLAQQKGEQHGVTKYGFTQLLWSIELKYPLLTHC